MQARRRSRFRSPYLWHRWLGLAAALPLVVAAITGLALNHTEDLKLDERRLTQPLLLDWYGIRPAGEALSFPTDSHWVSWLSGRLFLDTFPLEPVPSPPLGAVAAHGLLVVALPDALRLYTTGGEAVETLSGTSLPGRPRALGTSPSGEVIVKTDQGLFQADEALLEWRPYAGPVQWSHPQHPPTELFQALERAWRGEGLPMERVMLDLHSGRFFGRAGVWLMDAAALLVLLLAPTGIYLWIRALRRQREHRRKRPFKG